ncbi:ankyrin repeat domain-containing protein [Streptomyces sp. NPDC058701]|uniref:ankyrin repeat domain-containing protein n=1 Tax=Streptomyces sp. NPDC058701 TaxID=3346608 RepID=UPI003660A562
MTRGCWSACHGGQPSTAHYLTSQGADINRTGHDGLTPLDIALNSEDAELDDWLTAAGAHGAGEIPPG